MRKLSRLPRIAAALALVFITSQAATAEVASPRILKVGPGAEFALPSAAAEVARAGDTIEIAAGNYPDCAIWPRRAHSITIRAVGDGPVVMFGPVCEYKAIFVIKGDDVKVEGITFTGARAPFHNGAGIRAEGKNLTIENSRFLDNEEGILAAPQPGSAIVIRNSYFKGNGNCLSPGGCAHGVYVNPIERLVIENCQFVEQHIGHHIKSRAARTELVGNTIEDGPTGTASYLVDIPDGGSLVMRDNTLEKGPHSDNPMVAVTLGEEGNTNVTAEIIIENNLFRNDMPHQTVFVRNLTGTNAVINGNVVSGDVRLLDRTRPDR